MIETVNKKLQNYCKFDFTKIWVYNKHELVDITVSINLYNYIYSLVYIRKGETYYVNERITS